MRDSISYSEMLTELSKGFMALPDKPEETVESTLDALWNLAAGRHLVIEEAERNPLPELSDKQFTELAQIIHKRISGTPLAHITGRQLFMNLSMSVSRAALIPRKETELVGYGALNLITEMAKDQESVLVLDICTGAGNLGLAFAHYEPKTKVFGADLSEEAVLLANGNAVALNLSDRIQFFSGDLLEPFRSVDYLGKVDVLTCNPPYISSGKLKSMPEEIIDNEPDMAFNGGPFGISILSRLLKEAPDFVRPGGWLAFEVGEGQGPGIQRMMQKNPNYGEILTVNNSWDQVRAILTQIL